MVAVNGNSNEIELIQEPADFMQYRELYLQRKGELKPIEEWARKLENELKEKEKEHNEVVHRYSALDDPEIKMRALKDSQLGVLIDAFDVKLKPDFDWIKKRFYLMEKPYLFKIVDEQGIRDKIKWVPLPQEHHYSPTEKTITPWNIEEEILIKGTIEDLFDSRGLLVKDVPFEYWLFDARESDDYFRSSEGTSIFFSQEGQSCYEGTLDRSLFNENDIKTVVQDLRNIIKDKYNSTLHYGRTMITDNIKDSRDNGSLYRFEEMDKTYYKLPKEEE